MNEDARNAAAALLKTMDEASEDFVNLTADAEAEDLKEIARRSGVNFKHIELRVKLIRRGYSAIGRISRN